MFTGIRKEFRMMICSKSIGLLLFLLLPVLALPGYALAEQVFFQSGPELQSGKSFLNLGIVNEDDNEYSRLLVSYFEDNEDFTAYASIIQGNGEELMHQFDAGELDAVLVIPQGFIEHMINAQNLPVRVRIRTDSKTKAVVLTNLLDAYSNYIEAVEAACIVLYDQMQEDGAAQDLITQTNLKISLQLISAAMNRQELFAFEEESADVPLLIYYGLSFLAMMPCVWGIAAGLSLIREKKEHMLERLMLANIPSWKVIGAKAVSYGTLAMLSVFWFVREEAVLMLQSAGICMAAVLGGLFLALWFQREDEYRFAGILFLLFIAMAGGTLIPVSYLPDYFVRGAAFLPNFALADILLSAERGTGTAAAVWLWWAAAGVLWVAAAELCKRRRV